MHTLLNILLFLGVMTVYLAAIYSFGRYRRARAPGPGYRADKDVALRIATAVLGGLLCLLVYFVTRP